MEHPDQVKWRWIIRQVARRLRYGTVDPLIGQTVTVRSLQTIVEDIQPLVDEACPGSRFAGPEEAYRIGMLAKYAMLDLRYKAPREMAATTAACGLSVLKELGLIWHRDKADNDQNYLFDCLGDLLDDFNKDETILKLFLREVPPRPVPPPPTWPEIYENLHLIPFPKRMEIKDACITNSDRVWFEKHFYL